MGKVIKVKCWPQCFEDVAALKKPFDIRKDDRDYQVGDTVVQEEWDPVTKEYTGRRLLTDITYKFEGGRFGIESGYCILGIKVKYLISKLTLEEAKTFYLLDQDVID